MSKGDRGNNSGPQPGYSQSSQEDDANSNIERRLDHIERELDNLHPEDQFLHINRIDSQGDKFARQRLQERWQSRAGQPEETDLELLRQENRRMLQFEISISNEPPRLLAVTQLLSCFDGMIRASLPPEFADRADIRLVEVRTGSQIFRIIAILPTSLSSPVYMGVMTTLALALQAATFSQSIGHVPEAVSAATQELCEGLQILHGEERCTVDVTLPMDSRSRLHPVPWQTLADPGEFMNYYNKNDASAQTQVFSGHYVDRDGPDMLLIEDHRGSLVQIENIDLDEGVEALRSGKYIIEGHVEFREGRPVSAQIVQAIPAM